MPFSEIHEFYRIAYLKMEARMEQEEKEKQEEERRKQIEERQNKNSNLRGPRKPWKPNSNINNQKTSIPLSVDMDDFEELIEDGGLI